MGNLSLNFACLNFDEKAEGGMFVTLTIPSQQNLHKLAPIY